MEQSIQQKPSAPQNHPNLAQACIIPFVIYLVGTSFLGRLSREAYPFGYAAVAAASMIALWFFLRGDARRSILPVHSRIVWGVIVGVVGIIYWILLSHLHLEQWLTSGLPASLQIPPRASFNPLDEFSSTAAKVAFVSVRLFGIAVVVPLVEELFWRGFLLRWVIDPEWQRVPLGEFTWKSYLTVVALFTLAHPEWFAAAGYCLLINGLLYWKKDLWLCVIAHAVSNLILAIYVLVTGHWFLW